MSVLDTLEHASASKLTVTTKACKESGPVVVITAAGGQSVSQLNFVVEHVEEEEEPEDNTVGNTTHTHIQRSRERERERVNVEGKREAQSHARLRALFYRHSKSLSTQQHSAAPSPTNPAGLLTETDTWKEEVPEAEDADELNPAATTDRDPLELGLQAPDGTSHNDISVSLAG